jgi:hypothetical protein
MYTLIYVVNFVFLGTYADLHSCQNALHEIYATRQNAPNLRDPEVEKSIQIQMQNNTKFVCIPVKKVDK